MERQDDNELEQHMRTAFEPDAESIDRVIAGAIRHRRRPMRLRVAVILAMAGILLIALVLRFQSMHVRAESVRMEYVGSVILFEFPDGSSLIVSPDNADQGPTSDLNLIFLEGDNP